MNIGIFDSGFGGLAVFQAIHRALPQYDYLYLGDNARAPYGDRSHARIYEFTQQGVAYLFKQNCALVVLACTTASAHALRKLQQEWLPKNFPDRKILGIIVPLVEALEERAEKKKIVGIIATRATIQSHVFEKEVVKRCAHPPTLIGQACPLLVPLIEEGWHASVPGRMMLKKYLRPLKGRQISELLLGCTHYSILQKDIARIMGKNVRIIDPSQIVARALKRYLSAHPEIHKRLSTGRTSTFTTTDVSERINNLAKRIWGAPIAATTVSIE